MKTELFQQLVNGLAWGSIYALIALGYTMVYGVLRLINFAHGDVYMVGAMLGYYGARWFRIENGWMRFGAVLFFSMFACAMLGALIEKLAYRPLRQSPRIYALITAIGVSLFLEYAGQHIFGPDPKVFPSLIATREVFNLHGVVINNLQLTVFSTSFLLMLGLYLFVHKTRTGKAIRAVSFNPLASQLMGISVNRIISLTFVLGSSLAAAAGILVGLSNPKIEPLMGVIPGLKAFVAAVLGGIGSLPGALLGGLLMGILETFVSGYVSSTYRDALAFVLLIAILLFKPTGLLGKSAPEKV